LVESKKALSNKDLTSFIVSGSENTEFEADVTGKGYQNQTEQILYKTLSNVISDMFKAPSLSDDDIPSPTNRPLLYYMSLREHPVGSVYQSRVTTEPKYLFGGTWSKVENGRVLRSSSVGSDISNVELGNGTLTLTCHDIYYYPEAGSEFGVTNYGNYYKVSLRDDYYRSDTPETSYSSAQHHWQSETNDFYMYKGGGDYNLTLNTCDVCTWIRTKE
jgi:hypothetical protein